LVLQTDKIADDLSVALVNGLSPHA
jgi:hypothetical protein